MLLVGAGGSGASPTPSQFVQPPALVRQAVSGEGPPLDYWDRTGSEVAVLHEQLLGTGVVAFRWAYKTKMEPAPLRAAEVAASAAELAASYIARIRATFNLSVKQLAEVLEVERPTVYGWIRGERNPHKANLDEIARIHDLAKAVAELTHATLPATATTVPVAGSTLLDLLKEADTTPVEVQTHVRGLIEQRPPRRRNSFRALAEDYGFDMQEQEDGQERIDLLSGKVGE